MTALPHSTPSGAAAKSRRLPHLLRCAALIAGVLLGSAAASACPSCYGAAAGPVIDGMNAAVLVMVGVTGGVFSWIAAVALRIVRRERRQDQVQDLVREKEAP